MEAWLYSIIQFYVTNSLLTSLDKITTWLWWWWWWQYSTNYCALKHSALLFIRKNFKIFTCCLMSSYSRNHDQSWRCPPFIVEERGKENIVLLSRERLVCISVACVIGNYYQFFYTLPSCRIDSKSSQRKNSRLFAGIRCALRYLTEAAWYLFPIFVFAGRGCGKLSVTLDFFLCWKA